MDQTNTSIYKNKKLPVEKEDDRRKSWNNNRDDEYKFEKRSKSSDGRRSLRDEDYDSDTFSSKSYGRPISRSRIGETTSSRHSNDMFIMEKENIQNKMEIEKLKEHKRKLIDELKNKIRESKKYKKKMSECSDYYGAKLKKVSEEYKTLKSTFEKKTEKYEKKQKETADTIETYKKQTHDITNMNNVQKELLYRKEKQEKQYMKTIALLETDKKSFAAKKEKLENIVRDLSEKISKLQKIKDFPVEDDKEIRKDYEDKIDKLNKDKVDIYEKYKSAVLISNKNVEYLNILTSKLKELNEQLSDTKLKNKEFSKQITKDSDALECLRKEKDKLKTNMGSRIKELEKTIEDIENTKLEQTIEISKLKNSIDILSNGFNIKIKNKEDECMSMFSSRIENIEINNKKDKEKLIAEFNKNMEDLIKEKNKEIEHLSNKYKLELDKINKLHELDILKKKLVE
jgi:hypothetical protein